METLITAKTDALAFGGEAVGTVVDGPAHDIGKRVFISGALPHETVTAHIVKQESKLLKAVLHEIHVAHPERTKARCPVFSECGGCQLQHLGVDAQRQAKLEMVSSMLERQAKLIPQKEINLLDHSTLPAWNYRRRVSLHLSPKAALGFYKEQTGQVVEFSDCLIARPVINTFLEKYREAIKSFYKQVGKITIEEESPTTVSLVFDLREHAEPLAIPKIFDEQVVFIRITQKGKECAQWRMNKLSHTAGHFSQVNPAANDLLVRCVTELLSKEKSILELYAGSGNFTFALAEKGLRVHAVEMDSVLVAAGQSRVNQEKLTDLITYEKNTTEKFLKNASPAQAILLDPPRSGALAFAENAKRLSRGKVIYVSCALPTFIRDAKIIAKSHELVSVHVLDMFPQTFHVELIAEFQRR